MGETGNSTQSFVAFAPPLPHSVIRKEVGQPSIPLSTYLLGQNIAPPGGGPPRGRGLRIRGGHARYDVLVEGGRGNDDTGKDPGNRR